MSEDFDAAAYFEDLETQLSGAMDDETVEEIWTEMDPEGTFDGDDLNLEIAQKIKARRLVQIHPINAGWPMQQSSLRSHTTLSSTG